MIGGVVASSGEGPAHAGAADRSEVERRVLEITTGLVTELGTMPARGAVALDDSLDRNLGIGSLERVELLYRLEQAVGVEFPDSVMAEADTASDLVRAILAGEPACPGGVEAPLPVSRAGTPAPASARTLIEVLQWQAEADPDRTHVFLRGEDGVEQPITYGALWTSAASLAAGLRARRIRPGEAVALMLRTEETFFPTFFAVLLAGAVPVPIYPPFRPDRLEEYAARQAGILGNAQARLLVTFAEAAPMAGVLRRRVSSLREVTTANSLAVPGAGVCPPRVSGNDPALIQYTSGSTGDPKGVLLTHANILANIRALGVALGIRPDDVGVSWLPLYHDMGLIGSWLGSLYHAVPMVILSPLAFLARPARWLWAIHAHRATLSPAPNFAFELCAGKIRDDEIRGLDLGSWRLALNGSEPVSPETIERFTRRFAPYGFRPEAMCPVYGLAESAVGLTAPPPGRGPRVDRIAREVFERTRRAAPAPGDDATALRFVSCGRPLPGHDVRVVDAAGQPVGERVDGRLEFRGPSVMAGYFRNPAKTRSVLHEGWMDSGDLGYRADGELFITGRQKDLIIKAGRNLYPQEVEEIAGDVPGIRKGCVAAFAVADPALGTERLVVVAETRQTAPEARERLRSAVVERIVAALGIPPDTVVVSGPGAVLKTSSGKIRRSATREAYLGGEVARGRPTARVQRARLLGRDLAARLGWLARPAASLAYAAWVAAVLLLTVPALWALVGFLTPGQVVDRVVRRWCRLVLALTGCRLRVDGLEHLAGRGAVILAGNHASYVDSVALLAAIPADFRFVAKRQLASMPLVGTVIRRVGHLTVERADLSRSVADAERVTDALRRGVSLFFFPEGTFARAPGLLPFRLGAFKAAVETGRPVVPVAIKGTREILAADTWLPRPDTITIEIGPPLAPAGSGWREIVRLRDLVRQELAARTGERRVEPFPTAA